jgi:putative flippase GtrA
MSIKDEAMKFTIVGAVNFVLTLVIFTTMMKVLYVNYSISLATAWIVGMVFSYILNFFWVFKIEHRYQFRARFPKFFAASLLSICLNLVALNFIAERVPLDPFFVQLILTPFIVVFNFSTAKYWSLRLPTKDNLNG